MLKLTFIKNKIANLSFNKKTLGFLVFFFLFFPLISDGFILGEVFALFEAQLGGLSELVGPILAYIISLVFFLLFSGLALSLSVTFLEIAANPANVTIMESEAVQIGWQFTSALANTAIVIILIVIGIATILGKEKWGAKKTLPRLIIAALLVNFSLLLVGAVVDISQILINTFYQADLFEEMTKYLWSTWDSIWTQMAIYLSALAGQFIIPFLSPLAQFNIVFVIFSTGVFLPSIAEALISASISLCVACFLFFYGLFFVFRIIILQLLAIFSPLAFVAWILPKTKEYFDKWLDLLVQWSFVGILLFFFLLLGTTMIAPLQPDSNMTSFFLDWLKIKSIMYYYFMLAIYLGLTCFIAKKTMPTGGQAIIDGTKTAVSGFKKTVKPITKPAKEKIKNTAAENSTAEEVEKRRKKMEEAKGLKKLVADISYHTSLTSRKIATATGNRPELTLEKAKEKNKDKEFKGASKDEIKKKIESKRTPDFRKTQAIEILVERGELDDDIKEMAAKMWSKLNKETQKEIKKKRPDIHVDLAENKEEGLVDMIKEIKKMKPSEMKDMDLDNISKAYKPTAASVIARDGSAVKSYGDASRSDKETLVRSLKGTGEGTLNTFAGHIKKNKDKWPNSVIRTADIEIEEDNDQNEDEPIFDADPDDLTDEENSNFWNNN